MKSRTILVTGGAGFIGSCFVRQAIAAGERVITLDKLTYAGHLATLGDVLESPRHVFVRGDIGDRPLVREVLESHRPDWVVNFAAESHVDRSIDRPRAFVKTNVLGTVELLTATLAYWETSSPAMREAFRFLHVSSDEVYGSLADGRARELSSPYAPNSPYSASKAAADHFVRAFHQTYRLPTLITCSANNFGPHQFPEKLMPLVILNAAAGRPVPVYGDGQHQRQWLFVDDHCRALRRVLQAGRPGEVYHIGGAALRSNLEIVHALCDLVDELCPALPHRPCRMLITHVADRLGHDRRYALDSSKIRGQLGWEPCVSLDDGLRRTVGWYLNNPDWVQVIEAAPYSRQRKGI